MKRIDIYVDGKDKLTLDIYKDENDRTKSKVYKGSKCYDIIAKYCNGKIRGFKNINDNDISLEYKTYYVDVYDYKQVFRKNGIKPIEEDIGLYFSNLNIKKIKKQKVKRKNKYIKKKIIAPGLAFIVLGSVITTTIYGLEKNVSEAQNKQNTEKEVEMDNEIKDKIIKDTVEQAEQKVKKEKKLEEVSMSISYDDKSNTEKAVVTKKYYGDLIKKYSKQYGLDPKIVTAIATQERGIHSSVKDPGGAIGLMQIQIGAWRGLNLSAYNYETKRLETITVDEEKIDDINYNIKVGCMIFQNNIKEMKNNILAAIQCYNLGCTNMNKILDEYSKDTGRSKDAILGDINDTGWMEYRDMLGVGDPQYVEHVFSWIGDEININNVKSDGKIINLNINNNEQTKNVSIN